ncbi:MULTISPECIES: DUF2917 domain-containing protein [unclassified Achromobacter]|uniref:DUF2917 domain-containing protein n=1 Tax=unclassified Achromobacter TaxID=2626865 RepID=UPI0009711B45|nr:MULTISPECIES: DUF2917 domain-containing protein [unclassified Achromobacter]
MSFRLAGGSTMLLKRASGVRIVCHAGALWISEYRRFDDSVLQAGESLTVDSNRDVVISGLPDAQVALLSQGRCEARLACTPPSHAGQLEFL